MTLSPRSIGAIVSPAILVPAVGANHTKVANLCLGLVMIPWAVPFVRKPMVPQARHTRMARLVNTGVSRTSKHSRFANQLADTRTGNSEGGTSTELPPVTLASEAPRVRPSGDCRRHD